MRTTFHLVPAGVWAAREPSAPYAAPSLEIEGFIHCTDGARELMATADRYYRDDPRPYVAITIDLERAGSPWRIEDPAGIYPHVYGPIEREAIVAVQHVRRAPDGRFTGLGGSL